MVKKKEPKRKNYALPEQFDSIVQLVFVASWLDFGSERKSSSQLSFYGVDLLSRKICPDIEFFFSILSEITKREISAEMIFDTEFVIPNSIVDRIMSDEFSKEAISQNEAMFDLWLNIAAYETIEFINHLLKRIDSNSVCNSKALPIVKRLLLHYSTGQIWNLAYKANQKACEVILIEKLVGKDNSDLLLDIIMEKGLFYIDKGWDLSSFNRWGFQCRQSDLSKFFFDKVLGISENGFRLKPSLSIIKELSI